MGRSATTRRPGSSQITVLIGISLTFRGQPETHSAALARWSEDYWPYHNWSSQLLHLHGKTPMHLPHYERLTLDLTEFPACFVLVAHIKAWID
jgi:hypothetical protein